MKKITVKNLTPNAEEIIVTHKIGDISVRQYIKQHNLLDEMATRIIEGYDEDGLEEWLGEDIFDALGQPDDLDDKYYDIRTKEIMALIYDDAKAEADDRNERAAEFEKEKSDSYNELVGGNR